MLLTVEKVARTDAVRRARIKVVATPVVLLHVEDVEVVLDVVQKIAVGIAIIKRVVTIVLVNAAINATLVVIIIACAVLLLG